MLSRRRFLTGSATLLASVGFVPAWAGTPHEQGRALFDALAGTSFAVFTGRRVSYCSLAEVRDGPTAAGLEQFSLVFDHLEGVVPGDGVYDLWHPDTGVFSLYLQPTDANAERYVAVFSLIVD